MDWSDAWLAFEPFGLLLACHAQQWGGPISRKEQDLILLMCTLSFVYFEMEPTLLGCFQSQMSYRCQGFILVCARGDMSVPIRIYSLAIDTSM